jgi:hypothetical protein
MLKEQSNLDYFGPVMRGGGGNHVFIFPPLCGTDLIGRHESPLSYNLSLFTSGLDAGLYCNVLEQMFRIKLVLEQMFRIKLDGYLTFSLSKSTAFINLLVRLHIEM